MVQSAVLQQSVRQRVLLAAGAIAGPLFVVAFLLEDATRTGWDPMRLPISLLLTDDLGWTQVLNFLIGGALFLAFAIGLAMTSGASGVRSRWGPILVGFFAIGLVMAGTFWPDPGDGYPQGVPAPREQSLHSTLHDVASLIVFTMLPAACLVFARAFARGGRRMWSAYSALTGVFMVAGFVVLLVGFNATSDISAMAGLIERLVIVVGWLWLTLLAIDRLRATTALATSRGA